MGTACTRSDERLAAALGLPHGAAARYQRCRDVVMGGVLAGLWEKRIGAITYRKAVKDLWPESEFSAVEVPVPGGGTTSMRLAFRETALSAGEKSISVLEVRRLTETKHQTAIITTARRLSHPVVAGRMFSRWCQENFFAYMMEHYDIDGLVQYGWEDLPGTVEVVNPAWRDLDRAVADKRRRLRALRAEIGATVLDNHGATLVGLLRPHLARNEAARALVRELLVSSADIEPDEIKNTLTIRIHRMACPAHDKAIDALLTQLTQAAFRHPETGMLTIYHLA